MGPLLIVAGPGSGKTRTLTHRIAHLVAAGAVPAAAVLAITFTRRAAGEMRERLGPLLGRSPTPSRSTLFTRSASRSCARTPRRPACSPGFASPRRKSSLRSSRKPPASRPARLRSLLSRAFPRQAQRRRARCGSGRSCSRAIRRRWPRGTLVDFDDLVGRAPARSKKDAGLVETYRARFRFIAVDEFQDFDATQYRLLLQLAPPGSNVLCDRRSGPGDLRIPRGRRGRFRSLPRRSFRAAAHSRCAQLSLERDDRRRRRAAASRAPPRHFSAARAHHPPSGRARSVRRRSSSSARSRNCSVGTASSRSTADAAAFLPPERPRRGSGSPTSPCSTARAARRLRSPRPLRAPAFRIGRLRRICSAPCPG